MDLFRQTCGVQPKEICFVGCIHGKISQFSSIFSPECAPDPCQNGATCEKGEDGGDYTCLCAGSWQGQNCEIEFKNGKCLLIIS